MPNPPPALTLIVGSEDFLVERAISDVVSQARDIESDSEVRTIDAAEPGMSGILAEACSPSLFGSAAVVVVNHLESADDSFVEQLQSALTDLPEQTWIVAVHGGGVKGKKILTALTDKAGTRVDCQTIKKGRALNDFLAAEVRRNGKKMSGEAQSLLVATVGADVRALAAGCAQLASDIEGKEITKEHVIRYFGGATEVTGFQIADAIVERRGSEALHLLRMAESVAGDTLGPPTVSAVSNSIRQLVAVATAPPGMSERDLAVEAKVPPWKVRTLVAQSRRWNQRQCAVAMLVLADLDAAMKGGLNVGEQLAPEQKGFVLEQAVVQLGA